MQNAQSCPAQKNHFLWLFGLLFFGLHTPTLDAQEPTAAPPQAPITTPPVLPSVQGAIQSVVEAGSIAGAVVLVSHKGQVIHFEAQGFRDITSQSPMKRDTLFRIYSMTKPITSAAVLLLVDRGRIQLDDPIGVHLPELANLRVYRNTWRSVAPDRPVSIRDLLRHTSGLTYGFFSDGPVDQLYMEDHPLFSANAETMLAKLARLPLEHSPGEAFTYGVSTDVLGALVERVSGQPFGEFLQDQFFTPLLMTDTGFVVPDDRVGRFASVYDPQLALKESSESSEFRNPGRLSSGGGGLVSTASDYLRFCEMLLNKGVFQGERILEQSTVEAMTQNQLPPGLWVHGEGGFGLGVKVQMRDIGSRAHRGEFSWNGIASTHFWVSPSDELIVIALSQRQPYSNQLRELLTPIVYNAISQ